MSLLYMIVTIPDSFKTKTSLFSFPALYEPLHQYRLAHNRVLYAILSKLNLNKAKLTAGDKKIVL